ncbi:hypothetical protein [Thiolapillus brandeum]|nr:hypothetical protein [Thiolapillus brandeum]
MASVEKLSIALTHKEALQDQEIRELHRLWHEGLESGGGRYKSLEEIKQAARKRQVVHA